VERKQWVVKIFALNMDEFQREYFKTFRFVEVADSISKSTADTNHDRVPIYEWNLWLSNTVSSAM